MHAIITKVCIDAEQDPLTHGTFNLDHYCTSYKPQKLQNDHILYIHGAIFEHDKV